ASNWTLVWWRFRKHRLALISVGALVALYAVVLCPDVFSTQDPEATDARLAFIPIQRLHLFDGWRWSPWVPAVAGKRNPVTLRIGGQGGPARGGDPRRLPPPQTLSRHRALPAHHPPGAAAPA